MCEHANMTGYKFCPYCGKKLISEPAEALRMVRKTQRTDAKKYDLGFAPLHSAIWTLAEDKYEMEINKTLNIYNCPLDAYKEISSIAKEICEEIMPFYERHKADILSKENTPTRSLICGKYKHIYR